METNIKKFSWDWTLQKANFTKNKGKVFSCFACGGGSTMGYKLAGFDVVGCNDIDKKMIDVYIKNHKPKYSFLSGIQDFKNQKELPSELYDLDILDGSPPCSSFSMAGNREKDWGKEKKFREGQADQILDTLFFDFIDLAKRLQPKVVIAENVKGLMMGEAKDYVRKIYKAFKSAGYELRIAPYMLDSSVMGVPQRRERVFFIALRKDLAQPFMEQVDLFQSAPKLDMHFNEMPITFGEVRSPEGSDKISDSVRVLLENMQPGDDDLRDINFRVFGKESRFSDKIVSDDRVCYTVTAGSNMYRRYDRLNFTDEDYIRVGTFPSDYDFNGNNTKYIIGMSVPPVMVAQIASRVYDQWLKIIST